MRRPPRPTRTNTLFPYTTLFRSPRWHVFVQLGDREYRLFQPSKAPTRPPDLGFPLLPHRARSEEHTSELPSLMRISYAVFCLKKKKLEYKHSKTPTKQSAHAKSGHVQTALETTQNNCTKRG